MWQVRHKLNVPSLFAVGADPCDPRLREDSVPQGPKQCSFLRNRPVMGLRRPSVSVARECCCMCPFSDEFVGRMIPSHAMDYHNR